MMSSSTSNVNLDKSRQSSDCRGADNTDTSDKNRIATNLNDDLARFDRFVAPQSNSTERNKCAMKNLARPLPEGPVSKIASDQRAQALTKASIMNTPIVASVTTSSTTIASPSSSSSMITTTAKCSHLANSDSGIDSAGAADTSPNFSKELLTNQANLKAAGKRSDGVHQSVNGSLSESLTSTEGNRTPNVENLSKTNLYIRGLPSSTTDEDLYNMCAKFGNILSTKAIFDKTTGCCRGYGFVQYTTPQSAELAVVGLTKSGIQAQMARIPSPYPSHNYVHHYHHHQQHHTHTANHNQHHHYNQNNGGGNYNTSNMNANSQSLNNNQQRNNADPTNLYIANLPPNMSEHELELLLSNYGPVVSTRILRDERNNPRGVGFARMESRDKCQEIIEKLNGKSCKGSQDPLLVKFADGGNRKRHNQNHHHNSNHHQHHQKLNHDDNRWRESGSTSDPNSMSGFEQHGNIPLNNQMSDLSMLGALGYTRIQASYPPNMTSGTGYPTTLGPQTSAHQWLQPGPGQQWNVIPQQMMQPGGPSSSTQSAASAPFPYGHIPQLTSQMQGLQITHHSGAPIGGYLQPHHQWPPIWPHPIPSQHHQASVRLANPLPPPAAAQHQPPPPVLAPSETVQTFISGQEVAQNIPKQTSVSDTGTQIQVSAPM